MSPFFRFQIYVANLLYEIYIINGHHESLYSPFNGLLENQLKVLRFILYLFSFQIESYLPHISPTRHRVPFSLEHVHDSKRGIFLPNM